MMINVEVTAKTTATKYVEMIEGRVDMAGSPMNVYSFFIDGTLIDTGSQTLMDVFEPWFDSKDIKQIFLTHSHEDHTAGAAVIQQKRKIPIYLHESSIEQCMKEEKLPMYRQAVWGNRGVFTAKPFSQVMTSTNYTWDVIYTPGHASDHYAFYCRELKIMFTGDLFVQAHTKVIMDTENLIVTIQSLKKLLTYDFQEVYCCHAGYLAEGRQALEEKIRYLEEKQQLMQTLYEEGKSIEEIREVMFPRKYGIEAYSEGQWSANHTVRSLLNL